MARRSPEDIKRDKLADIYEKQANEDAKRKDMSKTQTDREAAERRFQALLAKELNILDQIAKLREREEKSLDSITRKLQDQIKALGDKEDRTETENDLLSKTQALQTKITSSIAAGTANTGQLVGEFETLNAEMKKALKTSIALEESSKGFLNDISNAITKIPLLGGALSKGFDAYLKSTRGKKLAGKIAAKLFNPNAVGQSQSKMGLLGAGVALTGAGIGMTLKRQQELKDQQRAIGLTNEQSKTVDRMQRGLLNSSKSMVISLEDARKASAELVDNFGTYGAENSILVDQQVKLTKAYGLQAEDASEFQRSAMITGQTTEEMKHDVLSVAAGFNKATGATQSLSGVMRTVSKISDSIRIQFKGNTQELTAAVMQAKALGTSMEDLNGIADNLLNIESSIENQVTAQLVTGRNINLDKARLYSLMDDMPGLMNELVKQEIDYNAYSKMNRVEKQATAAALGMNTDQMAKFVAQQELSKQLGIDMSAIQNQTALGLERTLKGRQEEIAKLAKAGDMAAMQYEKDNEALTTQEKMTAAVEQMSRMFQVLGPIIAGIGVAMTIMAVAAMITMGTVTMGIATGFGIAAGLATMGVMAAMATGGDVIGGQGPVVVGENGPEIVHMKKGNSVTPNHQLNSVGGNNKETNDLLRQLISKVDQPSVINIDGTTLNTMDTKMTMNRNYQTEAR